MVKNKFILAFALTASILFQNNSYALTEVTLHNSPIVTESNKALLTPIQENVGEPTKSENTDNAQNEESLKQATLTEEKKQRIAQIALPNVAANGAIIIDANTGKVLYEKNADTRFFPASITKILTALLVIENTQLDNRVIYSRSATTNLESGAVTLGLVEGDNISVRDSLYGLLLKSANEIANGLAEHVSGSIPAFANLMNQKAKELGCTNSNFTNPSGLNDVNHFTTARDMALIAKACFANETFVQFDSTLNYNFPATIKKPTLTPITMGHKMLNSADTRFYEGIIGGKTGYTSKAKNTLVTCAKRGNTKLITVILNANKTQYEDTKAMLDYGFEVMKIENE